MDEDHATTATAAEAPVNGVEQASRLYVGHWNRLISTTNWEKGRIIAQWREAMIASGAPLTEYSDEAWSRQVGGISPQHVGRLRRVFQRFGAVADQYRGLYWSHFHAAVEWDDAEMWLEGAVQSQWSVAQLRRTRSETLGTVAEDGSGDEAEAVELDEDFAVELDDQPLEARGHAGHEDPADAFDQQPAGESPAAPGGLAGPEMLEPEWESADQAASAPLVQPFASLEDMPEDLAEAFESFKLAILRHKTGGWQQVGCEVVLRSLEALKDLATAPAGESAPF